jgi:hypothetical protein
LLPRRFLLISKHICMWFHKFFCYFHRLSFLPFDSSFLSGFLLFYLGYSFESFCSAVFAFIFILWPCTIRPIYMNQCKTMYLRVCFLFSLFVVLYLKWAFKAVLLHDFELVLFLRL